MAWPQDARHFDFAAGAPVPADSMNAIQDVIMDIHDNRRKIVRGPWRYSDTYWAMHNSIYLEGLIHLAGTGSGDDAFLALDIDIPLAANAQLVDAQIKLFLAGTGMTVDLLEIDQNFATTGASPSQSSILSAAVSPSAGISTVTLTPAATWTFDAEKSLTIKVSGAQLNDHLDAALISYNITGA